MYIPLLLKNIRYDSSAAFYKNQPWHVEKNFRWKHDFSQCIRHAMSFLCQLFNYARKPELSRTSFKVLANVRVSIDDDERRLRHRRDSNGFTSYLAHSEQAICQSAVGAAGRFGYNWISLVRYCKYWQPGKLPRPSDET